MKKIYTSVGIIAGLFLGVGLTVQAGTILFPIGGGTGTSTAPTYGQILVGTSGGVYQPQATSTLGLDTTYTGTYPISVTGTTISTVATSSLNLTVGSFLSPNVSQWTNDAGYVTSSVADLVATSTNETAGRLSYWTTTSGTPARLGEVATGTISASGGVTVTAGRSAIGGALAITCSTADTNTTGCLTDTDWDTFNNKGSGTVTSIATTYPITGGTITTTGTLGIAFGTTTANTWADTQTFTKAIVINEGTTATSTFAGNVKVSGNLQVDGGFFAPVTLVSSGDATINGALTVTGATTLATSLTGLLGLNSGVTYAVSTSTIALGFASTTQLSADEIYTTGFKIGTNNRITSLTGAGLTIIAGVLTNGGVITVANNYPITWNATGGTGVTPTLAFGTTTSNTWAGTQTFTNLITGSISGNAGTVTTNANLSGVVTSVGNTTSYGSQTAGVLGNAVTGNTAPMATSTLFGTGTPGQVLGWVGSGIAWVATSTTSGGITSLNSQTGTTQTFATTSNASTNFTITSSGDVHTLNIPPASATANGLVTTGTQTFAGTKTFTGVDGIFVDSTGFVVGTVSSATSNKNFMVGETINNSGGIGGLQFLSADSEFRAAMNPAAYELNPNKNYTAFALGNSAAITEASSGNHPLITQLALKPLTITAGVATVSDTASLYIEGAATTTAVSGKNYSLWVDDVGGGGTARIDSIFQLGTTTAGCLNTSATGIVFSATCGSGTVTSIATTYPITGGTITTTGTIALAFGTTTSNTWAGTQTFTNQITGSISGLAGTATALASDPTDCGANTWANAIAVSGNLTCSAVTYAGITAMTSANLFSIISDETGGSGVLVGSASPTFTGLATFANSTTTQMSITATGHLYIPNGANPSVASAGDLAINTTAASSSLRYFDGTAERSLFPDKDSAFSFASSTLAYMGGYGASGTTTVLLANYSRPTTLNNFFCKTTQGTALVQFGDGTASTTFATCSTTGAGVSGLSNNTWTMRENFFIGIGSQTGNPGNIVVTADIRQDAD